MTFLAFLVLLVVSVAVTFVGIRLQAQDARIINLAGRQRMLLQQMASLTLGDMREGQPFDGYITTLDATVATFDETLTAMQSGGQIIDYTGKALILPQPSDPELAGDLENLRIDWVGYRQAIDQLLAAGGQAQREPIIQSIQDHSTSIIDRADRVVRSYENIAQTKLARLRAYQLAFLAAGLAVLGAGWWITRKSVVLPLTRLAQGARGIGDGRLETAIQASGPDEVRSLGLTMDEMRQQLSTSQKSLQQWAETLEARVDQRTRELEALAIVNREITSHLAIGDVLSSIVKKARLLSGAEIASLCLLDQDGKVLKLQALDGLNDSVRQMSSSAKHPAVDSMLQIACTRPCELHRSEGACQIIDHQFLASHLAVSLKSKDQATGVLCIGSTMENAFGPEIRAMLGQLAEVASIALENSRLYQQVENLATVEERQRIASEMHDGSLQTLSFLRIMAGWAKEQIRAGDYETALTSLDRVERAQDQAEQEIRRAIDSLEDRFPLQYTFQEQLTSMTGELSEENIPVAFQTEVVIPIVLNAHESEQALRIVREAITNAQKHSRSEKILVTLSADEEHHRICLQVRDFGVGFDRDKPVNDGRAHFGLKIMRVRAARLGGELRILSAENQGTEIILSWRPASFADLTMEAA